jgi:hypothetical protein
VSDQTAVAVPWITDEHSGYNDPEYANIWYAVRSPDGQWFGVVRDSGCVDLSRTFNADDGNSIEYTDTMHVCDIDDLIERLQALKIMAETHFGKWPE